MEFTDDDDDWKQVLNVQFPSPRATPIFGVDPASDQEFLLTIETGPFDVWRYWLKADGRVLPYSGRSSVKSLRKGGGGAAFIHAPYFLRAAKFWRSFLKWCDAQEHLQQNETSAVVGKEIRDSLETAFEHHTQSIAYLSENGGIPKTSCKMAILAIYSFTSGQGQAFRSRTPFQGLFGGYHAYGYYSSLSLASPVFYFDNYREERQRSIPYLIVAEDFLGQQQGMGKSVAVDLETGAIVAGENLLEAVAPPDRICFPSPQDDNPHDALSVEPPQQDDILKYLEEYERRLTTGQYRVDTMGTNSNDPSAISLFPQLPTTVGVPSIAGPSSSSLPVVSRAVTRGVEVIGSAVFSREGRDQFGFIYCIRVRLLEPGEEGYQSESERGFSTCQLQSRHWRITDDSTGQTSPVDGQGVIGMYPILREGEYSLQGDNFTKGAFQYQSCTGRMGQTGSFGGQIGFVPGHLQHPSGTPFRVDLNPFLLDSRPNFLY